MSSPSLDGSRLFAQIARELATQEDLSQTTQRIVELTTQLVGCDLAAVWSLNRNGQTVLKAANDTAVGDALDSILTHVEDGPARAALMTRHTVRMDDLETETRWPNYVRAVLDKDLPIRSALAYSLDLGERDLGALAMYSAQPNYFTELLIDIGGVIADHAAIALDSAEASDTASNLKGALESNRRIGMAIGILIALHHVSDKQAFDMLRLASQNNHVKLREVAEDVILTGALPAWPTRRPAA